MTGPHICPRASLAAPRPLSTREDLVKGLIQPSVDGLGEEVFQAGTSTLKAFKRGTSPLGLILLDNLVHK